MSWCHVSNGNQFYIYMQKLEYFRSRRTDFNIICSRQSQFYDEKQIVIWWFELWANGQWAKKKQKNCDAPNAYYMFENTYRKCIDCVLCAVCRFNLTHSNTQITKHLANLHDVKPKMTKNKNKIRIKTNSRTRDCIC